MRYLASMFLALLSVSATLSGQVIEKTGTQPEVLYLKIKSINFVKNNEYFNPVTEGYTLLGTLFRPELVYVPSEKVSLNAGVSLLKYSGTEKLSQIKPVLSTTLKLSEKISLTLGSLSGCDKHKLFDPHFDSERIYSAYAEDGFELTANTNHFFNDTWISWENFIFKGDSAREVFTFGESFKYTSSPVADFLRFEVPVQVQFKHFGGQISNYPEAVTTFFNLSAGLRINMDLAQKKYGEVGIEYLQFINNILNGESVSGITHGNASWIRLHYTYKALYVGAYYWKGHDFYAPNGNVLYGSVSDYQANLVVPYRRIFTNSFYLDLLPESYLELFLGLDTYYDVDRKRLDNAVALHLNFDKLIKLVALKH
jgi:hypothetical protein